MKDETRFGSIKYAVGPFGSRQYAINDMLTHPLVRYTHRNFSPDEYIYAKPDGNIYTEEGYLFEDWHSEGPGQHNGMRMREGGSWEDGWVRCDFKDIVQFAELCTGRELMEYQKMYLRTLQEEMDKRILESLSVEKEPENTYQRGLRASLSMVDDFAGGTLYVDEFVPPSKEDEAFLSESQIKKMLKYEKNPMRIKQLNKMLYGRKKR